MGRRKDEREVRIIGEVVLRSVYFAAGAIAFLILGIRLDWTLALWAESGATLVVVTAVVGIITAIVGPIVYSFTSTRGRGSLDEIKQTSRGKK